jgi:hypothetical protein
MRDARLLLSASSGCKKFQDRLPADIEPNTAAKPPDDAQQSWRNAVDQFSEPTFSVINHLALRRDGTMPYW